MPRVLAALLLVTSLLPAPRATAQPAAGPADLGLVYTAPGCPDGGSTRINLVKALFDHFTARFAGKGGAVYVASTGTSSLLQGDRALLAPESAADALAVGRFLAEAEGATREVLESGVPVLDSPYELLFQYPYAGHFDWVAAVAEATGPSAEFPDVRRRTGDVVRYTSAAGHPVLALEMHGEGALTPPAGPAERWQREFTAITQVEAPDDRTRLFSVGKRVVSGPRLLPTLAALRRHDDLLLHPGGLVPQTLDETRLALCAKTVAALRPDALAPREADLALGPAGLQALADRHGLAYVAANLQTADKTPFPRFRLVERAGRTIALIGLVDRDQVSRLPAPVRAQWKIERPTLALDRTLDALEAQLRRRPDLVVVLMASGGESWARVMGTSRVDVLLGSFPRADLLETRESVEVARAVGSEGGREGARLPPVLLSVSGNEFAAGRVEVSFEGPALRRLSHTSLPIPEDGPRDAELELAVRTLEEREVPAGARVLLPDVAEILKRRAELAGLVWGERILHRTGFRDYPAAYPGRFSDPLWMRFVTNLLREAVGAEVALSRNLPRSFDTVGPLTRDVLQNWTSAPDMVRVVELTGAELQRIASRMALQVDDAQIPAPNFLFAAGWDPSREVVAGRPLDPVETYRVAVTDAVVEMPDLTEVFAGKPALEHFAREGPAWEAAADGKTLSVREVVLGRLLGWAQPPGGDFRPEYVPELEARLLDQSDALEGRWMLRLNEVSATVASYANTDNVSKFAASRETRTTTPDNLTVMGGLDVGLIYDGPAIAWEDRVRGTFQRTVIDIEDVPPQERFDDLVASTELRLNAVRLEVGEGRVPLVPFVQAAFDTELTATPNPSESDPDATFPHQYLVRGSLGIVSYPGPRLREVRLGGLVQRDLSEDAPHDDFGLVAGYRLELPVVGPLKWSSLLDLRYTVPDEDDRATDLGLVLSAVNKLLVPVVEGVSVFAMVDVYLARGKLESNRELGGSYILGGGLQLSRIVKF